MLTKNAAPNTHAAIKYQTMNKWGQVNMLKFIPSENTKYCCNAIYVQTRNLFFEITVLYNYLLYLNILKVYLRKPHLLKQMDTVDVYRPFHEVTSST